jgi:hypothetical protein
MWIEALCGYTFWTGGSDVVSLVRLKATYLSSFSYQGEWKERSSFQVNTVAFRLPQLASGVCQYWFLPQHVYCFKYIYQVYLIVALGTLYKLNPGWNDNFSRQTTEITQSLI